MSIQSRPIPVPSPSVELPEADPALQSEVVRLRRMVHALAEMLVESGVVDASIVEGRLRLAAHAPIPGEENVEKPSSWWSRLFKRKQKLAGVVPMAMMPVDQTMPVQKLPFEVQSLYDEAAGPSVVAPGMTRLDRLSIDAGKPLGTASGQAPRLAPLGLPTGACGRCWKRAPLNSGSLCARCAVQHG